MNCQSALFSFLSVLTSDQRSPQLKLSYPKSRLRTSADLEAYYADTERDRKYFERRRKFRRIGDSLLFIFAFAEIILVGYATTQII